MSDLRALTKLYAVIPILNFMWLYFDSSTAENNSLTGWSTQCKSPGLLPVFKYNGCNINLILTNIIDMQKCYILASLILFCFLCWDVMIKSGRISPSALLMYLKHRLIEWFVIGWIIALWPQRKRVMTGLLFTWEWKCNLFIQTETWGFAYKTVSIAI